MRNHTFSKWGMLNSVQRNASMRVKRMARLLSVFCVERKFIREDTLLKHRRAANYSAINLVKPSGVILFSVARNMRTGNMDRILIERL